MERHVLLLDEGSFVRISSEEDGVVTGTGTIDGRKVCVYAHDFSIKGGSMSEAMSRGICRIMDIALQEGLPLIGLNSSSGARIQDGADSLAGFGEIFQKHILASGVIPQISGIFGPCAGGAVYSPALTDFTVMVKDSSYMFLTGPAVVKSVTGESVTKEDLGGTKVHTAKSGAAHFAAEDEVAALSLIRKLVGYLPSNNRVSAPVLAWDESQEVECPVPDDFLPADPRKAYDMHDVIRGIVDRDTFLEIHRYWAKNIIIGLARINGRSVGIVANQPKTMAGALDSNASRKAARFVRFCDAFGIPLLTLVDVPGFLCGSQQECSGVITHGAKLLYAYGEATVPKVTVTLRKSYGGAHITMGCKQLRGDVNLAWPSADIAVMGAAAAAEIIGQEISAPNLEQIVAHGHIDEIIAPSQTRLKIVQAFDGLELSRKDVPWKKHDNMPL
jgi:acetyl-CoA carboxylase carboxyltransferase component